MAVEAPPPLHWYLPHGVKLAFSEASDGDMRVETQRQNWLQRINRSGPCRVPRQIHGIEIALSTDTKRLTTADGVISHDDQSIGVYGADCPGICIANPHLIGLAHCGWRGTAAGIIPRLIAAMSSETSDARSTWQAFIGPGICARHYEVDDPVLNARIWPDGTFTPHGPHHAYLNLAAAITWDLQQSRIEDIQQSNICTHEDPRLHSYRWQGLGPIQLLAAWRH